MESQDHRVSIKDWAEADRPREKLLLKGKASLSDAELIGILIGSGNAEQSAVDLSRQILRAHGNDLNALARLSVKELTQFKGIGEAKAITIVSALELGRRRKPGESPPKPKIREANDIFELFHPELMDLPHEEFWILLLKRNNELISKERISVGGISGTVADPKVIFKKAIEAQASGLALIHNHPSGNLKPSREDERLTQKIKEGASLLDITLLDHLIYTDSGFFSFANESRL